MNGLLRRGAVAVVAVVMGMSAAAQGQLRPERVYHALGRSVPVRVTAPADSQGREARRELSIRLLEPATHTVVAEASVVDGVVDLATIFPTLWQRETPGVLYAQLVMDGEGVGPAVVVQPLLTPRRATALDPRGQTVRFATPGGAGAVSSKEVKRVWSGVRLYVDQHVVIETSAGEIEVALRPDAAPNTVWNFRQLVEGGLYDGTVFHRVIGSGGGGGAGSVDPGASDGKAGARDFMIQGGDPLGTGLGGPGYGIALEESTLEHRFGVVSMARLAHPDSAGSQFFICLSRGAAAPLDGAYAAFGEVVGGADVVRAIGATPVGPDDRPVRPITITRARLVNAPPRGEGLRPAADPLDGSR